MLSRVLTTARKKSFQNMMRKREKTAKQHIPSFPTTFSTLVKNISHLKSLVTFNWTPPRKKPNKNIVGKGENAGNQHFLLFQQCFPPFDREIATFEPNEFFVS